jgi:hypothetical protein
VLYPLPVSSASALPFQLSPVYFATSPLTTGIASFPRKLLNATAPDVGIPVTPRAFVEPLARKLLNDICPPAPPFISVLIWLNDIDPELCNGIINLSLLLYDNLNFWLNYQKIQKKLSKKIQKKNLSKINELTIVEQVLLIFVLYTLNL